MELLSFDSVTAASVGVKPRGVPLVIGFVTSTEGAVDQEDFCEKRL